jgi:hypothetical protein
MGFDRPKDESEFSRRHDLDLQENLLLDLIDAVFANRTSPILDSGLREADLHSMTTVRRGCERMMTSKREQRLNPMAATRIWLMELGRKRRAPRPHGCAEHFSLSC